MGSCEFLRDQGVFYCCKTAGYSDFRVLKDLGYKTPSQCSRVALLLSIAAG